MIKQQLLEMEFRGLRKIISGGQDGVDRGALLAAKEVGVETGGWAPKGYRTTRGSDLSLKESFGLLEHSSDQYPPRTEQNVVDSDGTLIIASTLTSPGTALTRRYIQKHGRPSYVVKIPAMQKHWNLDEHTLPIFDWMINNSIEVLNVAGNHKNPALHQQITWEIVSFVLVELDVHGLLRFTGERP